ncbi:MAG: IPT/TIG domain-containing protein [bacterium]
MLRYVWHTVLIGLLLTSFACGSDVSDPGSDANNTLPDIGSLDAGNDTQVEDDATTTPDQGGEEDFGLFDFGNFDFGGDMALGPLTFDTLLPPRGPITGGTQFVIEGTGFTEQTLVYFGSRQADVRLVEGRLVGQTPVGQGIGPVNVKGLDPTSGEFVLEGGFEYVASLTVDNVTPSQVPSVGGVEVTVTGTGFDAQTRVSFGGITGLRHTVVSPTTMRVITPPNPRGQAAVRATNRDATALYPAGIAYYDTLSLDNIRPATADVAGGLPVTLTGTGFDAAMVVEFDGVAATVQSVDPTGTSAVVLVPAHPAGLVNVRLETASDAVIVEDAFYYAASGAFAITSAQPAQAPAIGGSEVTLLGAGLDAANLAIEVDGLPATIVESGPGHVTIQVPAHAPGIVDIYASAGTKNSTLSGFEYVNNLWIDSVSPNTDATTGGATVTIVGEGFTSASSVFFGLVPATYRVIDDQTIEAIAPSHSAGVVDVRVKRGDIEARFKDAFTFTEPLDVYSLTPIRGSIAGNTYVVMTGRGFVGNVDVTFDGVGAADVQVLDAQTLAVRTPPHPAGIAIVKVARGQEEVTAPSVFTYYNPGARLGGAWGGPIQGSVNVTVYEMGGAPIENAFVMLSTNANTPYQGVTDINGMVTLSGPDVYGEQTITAVASGYSAASIQKVDAENVTLFLSPPPTPGSGNPPPTPIAFFNGRITGLDKLAEPGPTQFQMAYVQTTQTDPDTDNPDPGAGNTVYADGNYTLNSRVGDVALVAVGGIFDNATGVFTPLRMGVARFLVAADQQVQTVDIDLDIPLETKLTFKLDQSPLAANGPDINQVTPYLDFGFEGVYGGYDIASGTSDIIQAMHQPRLAGVLADISYLIIGGATTEFVGVPFSTVYKRNVRNVNGIIQLPPLLGVPVLTSPVNGNVPTNRLFQFTMNSTNVPSFFYVRIVDFQQTPIWDIFLPGNQTSFRLPDFPSFANLPPEDRPSPYPLGTYILQIFAVREPGFSYATVSYGNLDSARWEAFAANVQLISF